MGSSEMGERARVGWIRLPPSHWRRTPLRGHSTPRSPPFPICRIRSLPSLAMDHLHPKPRTTLLRELLANIRPLVTPCMSTRFLRSYDFNAY